MAKNHNASYWSQRMKRMEDALKDRSYTYVENLERQFQTAQAEVERQIAAWYQRFATNNEISLADAKRLLTSGELAEFRWSVGEYIAYGQQNALDGSWLKQLENASARVHVSRLEALKLHIQQQAEVLYGNQLDALDAAVREMYLGSYYHTAFEVQRGLGVAWNLAAINEHALQKVLSRPWTADGQTFRDRYWTNQQALVNTVNTQLTQMIIRGEAPDAAIRAVSKQFNVSRAKAGRLIMTESAAIASAAQKDCFAELGVERYQVVATFDSDTCDICGDMDGQVFKMSEYQVGLTAPPFHPWCRCCTAPYFEDMAGLGERWTRNPDGSTSKVPADMTFEEWQAKFLPDGGSGLTEISKYDTIFADNPDEARARRILYGEEREFERDTGLIKARRIENFKKNNLFLQNDIKITISKTEERGISRVELHRIDNRITKAKKMMGITGTCDIPIVIASRPGNIASYNPRTNVIFIDPTLGLKNVPTPEMFVCSDDPLSTLVHEMFHWQDAYEYRKSVGVICDQASLQAYTAYQLKHCKSQLIRAGVDLDDVNGIRRNISAYAEKRLLRNGFEEVFTEYRTKQLLEKR